MHDGLLKFTNQWPLSVSLSTRFYEESREALSGLMVAAIMLGIGIGSSTVGFLRDQGWISLAQAFFASARR